MPVQTAARRKFWLIALIVAWIACAPTEPCACSPVETHGVVYGVVTDTVADQPVAGATIRVATYDRECGDDFGQIAPGGAQTDEDGAYELHFSDLTGGWSCVRVMAIRQNGEAADTVADDRPDFPERSQGDPPARVRVDLVFGGS